MSQVVLDFKVATANLMELPRHDSTIDDDVALIQSLGPSLVLWQEAANSFYRKTLKSLKRLSTIILRKQADYDVPFGYDPKVITPSKSSSVIKIQDGWPHVTPNRYLASQRFNVVGHAGVQFVARDAHPIAGAWNAKGGSGRKGSTIPRRQKDWTAAQKKILRRLTAGAKSGVPQILGADTNRNVLGLNLPATIAGRKVQKVHNGFDFIYFIDGANYTWKLVGAKVVKNTHSDHNVVLQRVQLIKK